MSQKEVRRSEIKKSFQSIIVIVSITVWHVLVLAVDERVVHDLLLSHSQESQHQSTNTVVTRCLFTMIFSTV